MKKLYLMVLGALLAPLPALANPACAVCTVAIGASLGVAREMGVSDAVVGLWAGALLTLLGYWTIVYFDKSILTRLCMLLKSSGKSSTLTRFFLVPF